VPTGRLYRQSDNEFISDVNYQFHNATRLNWWGELTVTGNVFKVRDGEGCILEVEDGRKGKCYLKKMVNRAVSAVPSRFVYRFTGTSTLD